jgi:hypothetical protein
MNFRGAKTENLLQIISNLNGCKGSDFCIENEPRMQEKCSFLKICITSDEIIAKNLPLCREKSLTLQVIVAKR